MTDSETFDQLVENQVLISERTAFNELSYFFKAPKKTFFNIRFESIDSIKESIVIMGVPFEYANPRAQHLAQTPNYLRGFSNMNNYDLHTFTKLHQLCNKAYPYVMDRSVFDIGDIFIDRREDLSQVSSKLERAAKEVVSNTNTLMSIGGDHSITYPLFNGVKSMYPDLVCIHIDAHNDIFLPNECAFKDLYPSHGSVIGKLLFEENEVYSHGLRSLINSHSEEIEVANYHFSYTANAELFIQQIEESIQAIGSKSVYLTVDLDVLDPHFFQSVTNPLPSGIGMDILMKAITLIKSSCNLKAIDIVECDVSANREIDAHSVLTLLSELVWK